MNKRNEGIKLTIQDVKKLKLFLDKLHKDKITKYRADFWLLDNGFCQYKTLQNIINNKTIGKANYLKFKSLNII